MIELVYGAKISIIWHLTVSILTCLYGPKWRTKQPNHSITFLDCDLSNNYWTTHSDNNNNYIV